MRCYRLCSSSRENARAIQMLVRASCLSPLSLSLSTFDLPDAQLGDVINSLRWSLSFKPKQKTRTQFHFLVLDYIYKSSITLGMAYRKTWERGNSLWREIPRHNDSQHHTYSRTCRRSQILFYFWSGPWIPSDWNGTERRAEDRFRTPVTTNTFVCPSK